VIFNLLERHRDKWVEDGECYRWIAALGGNSKSLQGVVGVNRKIVRVPRIVCGEAHGPPPTPKHHAAHDTPNGCIGGLCVNGEHLRWATARENQQDISSKERSERIKRGAAKMTPEARKERHLKMLAKRWPRQ
jgi:hypothetical protein